MWIILFFLLFFTSEFDAMADGFWTTYTTENGLESNDVTALTADPKGGIWVGTFSGYGDLWNFDGISWTKHDLSGVRTRTKYYHIRSLAFDNNDILWCGTFEERLFSYDRETWQTYPESPIYIYDIGVDSNNAKWLGTSMSGLYSFDGTSYERWYSMNSSIGNDAEVIAVDIDDTIWVGAENRHYIWHFNGETFTRYDAPGSSAIRDLTIDTTGIKWFSTDSGLHGFNGEDWFLHLDSIGEVLTMAIDNNGIKWCGTPNGVWKYDDIELKHYTVENSGLKNNYVWKIAVDNNNVKWFATKGGGLTSLDDQSTVPQLIVTFPVGSELLDVGSLCNITWSSNNVENISIEYSADGGNSWSTIAENMDASIGFLEWTIPDLESDACLIKITDSSNPVNTGISSNTFNIKPPSINVTAPNGGEVWEGTTEHVITWTASPSVLNVRIEYSINAGETWNTLADSVSVESGSFPWKIPNVNTNQCTVKITDIVNSDVLDMSDSFITIEYVVISLEGWTTYRDEIGASIHNIHFVTADPQNGVWISTTPSYSEARCFISYFDGLTWSGDRPPTYHQKEYVSSIAFDHDGVLWCSTPYASSYDSFNPDRFLSVSEDSGWQVLYDAPGMIFDIRVDDNNVKWFGTKGNGLYSFDGNKWEVYDTTNSNIKADDPWSIAIDSDNTIWMAYYSGIGVSHFNGSEWAHYTHSEGLLSDNVCSITVDNSGKKWFATSEGVSVFDGTNWSAYKEENGLISNNVLSVTEDYNGVIWIGTDSGISSFDGIEFVNYTTINSGLGNNYVKKVDVDIDNIKWFATSDGVSIFDDMKTTVEMPETDQKDFMIFANYPNPFNLSTNIIFAIPSPGYTTLTIYNITGQKVRELAAKTITAGTHSVVWHGKADNGNAVSSGIYLSVLQSSEHVAVHRILLMK